MKANKLLVVLTFIVISDYLVTGFSYNTPEAAIRKHLFWTSPCQILTCNIEKSGYTDKVYGQQYTIQGYIDPGSKSNISYAYVKESWLGWNYWSGGGSGP